MSGVHSARVSADCQYTAKTCSICRLIRFIAIVLMCFAESYVNATPASADVVWPPPRFCPPGAIGVTSHGGPYCAPATCRPGTDACSDLRERWEYAPGQMECQRTAVCIEEQTAPAQGYQHGSATRHVVRDLCTTGGDCPFGECLEGYYCVERELRERSGPNGGCSSGCSSVKPRLPMSNACIVAILVVIVLVVTRRS